MKPAWGVMLVLIGTSAFAQTAPTMKQLMQDLIYPASNDILLFIYRGQPKTEMEWANVRRSAITLAESGNLLTMPGRVPASQRDWAKDAKTLSVIGTAAYKAAQSKDFPALAALADSLDASCTTCHKQYRPNVFPRSAQSTGGSK